MKTFWISLISAVLAAAIAVGCVFLIQGATKKGNNTDKYNTSYSIQYLDSRYEVGDDVVYAFVVHSDIQFKSLTYKLANGEEQNIENVKFGESDRSANANLGRYYADTKVQVVNTADLKDGYYTLVFFGYDKDNNRYELNETPYSFKLVAVEAETPAVEAPATETPAVA